MRYVLGPYDVLRAGEQMHSGCHRFILDMQTDGHLVLYAYDRRMTAPTKLWHMGGGGDASWFAIMRPNGILCVSDGTTDRFARPDPASERLNGRTAAWP